jgi:AcrR family transcriptional regulator
MRAERKKDEILDVARRLFLQSDFSSVTMEAVASEVLLSRVTLYQYFPNKMELFASILIRDMNHLVQAMRAAVRPNRLASENLDAISTAYLDFFRERPEYFKKFSFYFLPGRDVNLPEDLTLQLEQRFFEGIKVIQECISDGIKHGELREVDPKTASLAHWSLLMGAAYAAVTGYARRQNLNDRAVSTFGLRTFIEGIKRNPSE